MTPPTPTKDKPADEPVAPPDPVDVDARFDELTAKLEELEAAQARNVELYVSSTDFEKALETVVPAKVAEAIQAALEGASKPVLDELAAKLEELTAKASEAVDPELEKAIQWAHAKISALHVEIQRAIGVTINLPESPTHQVAGDTVVTGTETADRLVH